MSDPKLLWIGCGIAAAMLLLLPPWRAYVERRLRIDPPGGRHLHRRPTPRGGGAPIAMVWCAGCLLLWPGVSGALMAAAAAAVAWVGWLDDRRELSAWPRLVTHALAAGALAVLLLPPVWAAVGWLPWVWLINLTNFSDGLNGLVGAFGALCALVLAVALLALGAGPEATLASILAGACLGFLPYNFPRATIFLGDVGSGTIGIALGTLLVLAWRVDVRCALLGVLFLMPLLIDTTLTLLWRLASRRTWYRAHRQHLYQWLARIGLPAGVITPSYALIGLLGSLIGAGLMAQGESVLLYWALLWAALLALSWWGLRRALLVHRRGRR